MFSVMESVFVFILLLFGVDGEEVATPSSALGPRNFNNHAYQDKQFLFNPEPTKHGPVLFPNDAPPPPRPPLIVTSRPLIESVARSELNPSPLNNTVAEQSQVNGVSYKPDFLARGKYYKPFAYTGTDYSGFENPAYVDATGNGNGRYDYEVEEQTPLAPIYNTLSNDARHNTRKQHFTNYAQKPGHSNLYKTNEINDDGSDSDYNHGSNYAFSYAVKDQKTGDDFSHSQHSTGSATNGEYRVRLPDGRMQIVSYTADENGYQADVRYDDNDKTAENSIDKHCNSDYNSSPNYNDNQNRNYEVTHNNNGHNHDIYKTNSNDYADTGNTKNDHIDNDNIYAKPGPSPAVHLEDYNQYRPDASREYYNDYNSQEFGKDYGYAPHTSKFSAFSTPKTNLIIVNPNTNTYSVATSTVKPSYQDLKPLFVTRKPFEPTNNYINDPVNVNIPSSTANPLYDFTTEHVVVIGGASKPNLYTNIRSSVAPITGAPNYPNPNSFVSTTARNFLVSTIANLKSRLENNVDLSGPKPVLSDSFINRINKYLTFN